MKIFVRTPTGKIIDFTVQPYDSIQSLKEKLSKIVVRNIEDLRLFNNR
jgi:hypothetical protein